MKHTLLSTLLLTSTLLSLCACSYTEPETEMNGLIIIKQDGVLNFDLDYNGKDPGIIAVGLVFLCGWSVFMIYVMCKQDWKFAETEEDRVKAAAATAPTTANTQNNQSTLQVKKLDSIGSPTNKDKVTSPTHKNGITSPANKNGITSPVNKNGITSPANKSLQKQTPKSSKAASPKKDLNENEIALEVNGENLETSGRRRDKTETVQPDNEGQVYYKAHTIDCVREESEEQDSSEEQVDIRSKSIELGALDRERRNLEFEGHEVEQEVQVEEVEQPVQAHRRTVSHHEKVVETEVEEPRHKIEVKVHQGEHEEGWSYEKEWKLRKMMKEKRKGSRDTNRDSRTNVSVAVEDASHHGIRLGTKEHDLDEPPMALDEALGQSINETNRDPHTDMDLSSCGFVNKSKIPK